MDKKRANRKQKQHGRRAKRPSVRRERQRTVRSKRLKRKWVTQTLYVPTATPDVRQPLPTRSKRERRRVGKWMAALNAAGRGDFSRLDKFPRRFVIAGVRLPTSREEVQPILKALAEEKAPFEGLYHNMARRS